MSKEIVGIFIVLGWSYVCFACGLLFEAFRRDVLGWLPPSKRRVNSDN